jgi:tellurite resistance protein
VISQVRLFPAYFRLSFTAGFWSFTFPWFAAASLVLDWIKLESPSGQTALNALVLASITVLLGGIGIRTLIALGHGQLFPQLPPTAQSDEADTATPLAV